MASAPPQDTLSDETTDDFTKLFNEFASGNTPDPLPEEQAETTTPEGNDPEEQSASAEPPAQQEEQAPAEPPAESVTSGQADGGEQPPSGEQAPDPLAGLTDEQKELFRKIERERDEARHKASSDANRVAALSRKLHQITATGSAALAAPPEEPTEAQKALDEKIKKLRAQYGDIADPLIELIEAQKAELSTVRKAVTNVAEERQAAMIAAETAALEATHPDWREVAQSPEFAGWLEIQPDNIQRLAASWDARESSVVLSLFKTERIEAAGGLGQRSEQSQPPKDQAATAATDARRSQQLDASRDVGSRPAPATSGPPEDYDAAFAYYQKLDDEKRAKARR